MKYLQLFIITMFLSGCVTSGYQKFYNPYVDATTLKNIELLAQNQEPKLYGTKNFEKDIRILRSKQYLPIGQSSFNGGYEDISKAIAQAKRIGATIVLVNSEYTNTQTSTSTLFLPDNKTTYYRGSGYANTSYNRAYAGYLGSSLTNVNYNATSTTYGTKAVPITTHQRRYNQNAVFLVRSTKKLKFGVYFKKLTSELRKELERNTGVLIDIVVEDSPTFNANVLPGDVLIKVDDHLVKNPRQAVELMKGVNASALSSTLTVIRKNKEKEIEVVF